jgi:hypothetical protein
LASARAAPDDTKMRQVIVSIFPFILFALAVPDIVEP